MQFTDLGLAEPILRSLESEQYSTPTPIQAQSIPHVMKGLDLLGSAQTGTGKTAAFALPILHEFANKKLELRRGQVRCLVLAPTRELAVQIDESFRVYGKNLKLKHATVFGGVSQHSQERAVHRGVDVMVATPGRLLDLVTQKIVDLSIVEVLVLDEADRMLDMGFINDIRKLVARIPTDRQTLMFSATMPPDIRQLAETILKNPIRVEVAPVSSTVDRIDQCVYMIDRASKPALLTHLIQNTAIERALVFTRTKHGADRVVRQLFRSGIRAEAIHGNKSQNARQRALQNFKSGKTPILIASDIASRGIDVDGISHVFNYDLTHEPETYVHRIGRTARAGAEGHAISFCDGEERSNLRAIERLIRKSIRVATDAPKFSPAEKANASVPRGDAMESSDRGPRREQSGGRDSSRDSGRRRDDARRPQFAGSNAGGTGRSNDRHDSRSGGGGSSHREGGSFNSDRRSGGGSHRSAGGSHPPRGATGVRSAGPSHAPRGRSEGHAPAPKRPNGHAPTHRTAAPAARAKHPLDRGGAKRHTASHAKH